MASMETSKRHSTASTKVATPKQPSGQQATNATAPAPAADLDHALARSVGARVRITTTTPTTSLEGTLFATDRLSNIVAIASSSQPSDFHLIHTSRIQSFVVVSLAPSGGKASFADVTPSIGPVDLDEAEKREAQAVAAEKEKEARRKQGVDSEAEELFTALGRMLPVRWAGAQMVVNENVLINAPFRPEDCQAPKGNEAGLARVKKVVENERRKYAERSDGGARGAKPANATPVRKGG